MVQVPAKPPRYWMDAKQRAGVNAPGAGRIWYRIYKPQKRLLAWLVADDSEWAEHGLTKPSNMNISSTGGPR